jgi:hypothetical protein
MANDNLKDNGGCYSPAAVGIIALYLGVAVISSIIDTKKDSEFMKAVPAVVELDSVYTSNRRQLGRALHILDSTHTAQKDSLRKEYDLENKVGGK